MTRSFAHLWPIRWPTSGWIALLATLATAAPAAASAPAPLRPLVEGRAVVAPVLFKYEELFGRSAGASKPFRQIDLDGNGRLSPEELQHAFGSRWQSVLSNLDQDADGLVTPEEVKGADDSRGKQGAAPGEQPVGSRPGKPGNAGESNATEGPARGGSGKTGSRANGGNGRSNGAGAESRGEGSTPGRSRGRD